MTLTQHATSARPHKRMLRALAATFAVASLVGMTACSSDDAVVELQPQVEGALPADIQAALQESVEYAMAAGGATGAIVSVQVPWSGEWVAALGTTGPGGEPVTTEMSFRGAAVTRMMTCDALYGLATDGVVNLDDSVSKWVTGARDLEPISLRQLCDSSSGLGASGPVVVPMWYNTPDRQWAPKEIAMYGRNQLLGDPGVHYFDSDAGYHLLGYALERVSKETALELFDKYSIHPLELTGTTLPGAEPATPTPEPYLPGYYLTAQENGLANCAEPVNISKISASLGFTDSGITTTIDDLARYVRADAAQLIPWQKGDELAAQRFDHNLPAWDGAPTWINAGGGAFHIGPLIGQYGFVPGYSTAAFSDPATGFTVAVVLNNSQLQGAYANALALELAAIASKAAPAAGQSVPEFGLPFTADTYKQELRNMAVCSIPGEEPLVAPEPEPQPEPGPAPEPEGYTNPDGVWVEPWERIEWRQAEDGNWYPGYWTIDAQWYWGDFVDGVWTPNDPGFAPMPFEG